MEGLVKFGDRSVGSSENREAATYLQQRLSALGLEVTVDQEPFRNVIANLKGTNQPPRDVLMVGAHYDSVKGSPGATDNAAGVAIVLEVARLLKGESFPYDIRFAFWNAEESGGGGSKAYVKELSSGERERIRLYLNFDSVGFDKGQKKLDLMYNPSAEEIAKRIPVINQSYKLGFLLTHNTKTCFSDHRPFWEKGITALMFHCADHGPAHTRKDTPDQVSYSFVKSITQLGLILLLEEPL